MNSEDAFCGAIEAMIRVGIAGVGFMSWIHYLAYRRCTNVRLSAFCSRDVVKRSGDWRGIQGNFGPPGEQIDMTDLTAYADLESMLADPSIQLVDICLPPHLHAEAVRKSLAAGKWVLCEKPLALTAADAEAMVSASQGKLLVAHILPFFAEYRLLKEAVADGRFGKLLGGRFKRIIGPPSWIPDFYDLDRVGGPLIDLHVHDAHLIAMLLGMPRSVDSIKRLHPNGVPQYVDSLFHFSDREVVVSAVSGVIHQGSRGFTHGYDVQFEKANIQFEFAAFGDGSSANIPLTIAHLDGSIERPATASEDSIAVFVEELEAAGVAASGGAVHPALDAKLAAEAIRICELQM